MAGGPTAAATPTRRAWFAASDLLSLTTGGPADAYQPDGFNGDIQGILRPIHRGMLRFVGFDVLAPHIVLGPIRLSDDKRRRELERLADRLTGIAEEQPIEVGRY